MSLQITAWDDAAEVALGLPIFEEEIAITASSVQSNVIDPEGGNRHRRIRLYADSDCYVTWGDDPTATADGAGGRKLGLDNPEYFDISASHRVAVIQRT